MAYMTRQRHKLETHWGDESNASESTAELHAGDVLRAGSTHWELFVSLFHPLWDYQCFGWFVGFVCVVVWGGFLVVLFCWVTGIRLSFAFRMHKVVIHSKTVTIVMMSAAQEQKLSRVLCQLQVLLKFLFQRAAFLIVATVGWCPLNLWGSLAKRGCNGEDNQTFSTMYCTAVSWNTQSLNICASPGALVIYLQLIDGLPGFSLCSSLEGIRHLRHRVKHLYVC